MKQRDIKITYVYEKSEDNERRIEEAYDILFEEVLRLEKKQFKIKKKI